MTFRRSSFSCFSRCSSTAVGIALLVAVAATSVARSALFAAAQSSVLSPGLAGPPTVNPDPICDSDDIDPFVNVVGQGRFDADRSNTVFGKYKTSSGMFGGQPYNRTRTKTVTEVTYTDKHVQLQVAGLSWWETFYGEDSYAFSAQFPASRDLGTHTGYVNATAFEQETTTTTSYIEYWFKSGNNSTLVGTSAGVVLSSQGRGMASGGAFPFTYEVIHCSSQNG